MTRPAYDRYSFLDASAPEMTPLIDCVMLLLVFFMVTTAFFSLKAIQVAMPGLAEGTATQESVDINVYITATGQIQVDGVDVALDRLQDALAEAVLTDGRDVLILEAAATVVHEKVIEVLDRAKGAGVTEIHFARMEDVPDGS